MPEVLLLAGGNGSLLKSSLFSDGGGYYFRPVAERCPLLCGGGSPGIGRHGISGLTERSRDCFTSCKEDSKAFSVRQLSGRVNGLQRHIQGSQYHMQFGRSLQVTFLLVLSIVLIVPFVLYST